VLHNTGVLENATVGIRDQGRWYNRC
jgi:hypothetical protein